MAPATRPNVILASFGDMRRVPGTSTDLLSLRARGADMWVVYAPTDAVRVAAAHPDRQVVFLAVGFETTAPANAMASSPRSTTRHGRRSWPSWPPRRRTGGR